MKNTKLLRCFLIVALSTLLCTPALAADKFLKIGSGPVGGYWVPLAATWSTLITEHVPGVKASSTPGGSISNLNTMKKGNMDLGYGKGFNLVDAYEGRGPFEGKRFPEIRAIASIYIEPLQILFPKEMGVKTVQDLKGKSCSPGQKGYGGEILFNYVLQEAGMTYKDLKGVSYLNFSDAALSMKDRNLDFVAIQTSAPSGSFLDVDVQTPIAALEIEPGARKVLEEKYGLFNHVIPGNTYKGMNGKDVTTIASSVAIFATNKLSEDIVYQITKVMWENVEQFHAVSPTIKQEYLLKNALLGITTPLHKGAYKYYAEMGLAIPPKAMPVD